MAGHGQTLNDRLNAARYALAGQGLAKVVCKATTEEVIGPKKKHLDYLLQCTHEPNVSIPQLANLLIERTNHSSWVVVFKSLVTVHHLMCYGNERFTQYLASSNCTFQLSNFLDKNIAKGYEMSTFIRRYAKYLNEKALSYRTVAFDFTKIKRGKEEGSLRAMNTDKLLKTIPILQSQVDALLEFDCSANDLTNGVINAAFMLLFRDLIRLFACYNDGIINCLEKYFDMNKKHAREALDIYKKFLIRMDKVAEFLKVAENVGIDKGEIPDLAKAPSSLLDALEQHLAQLEGRKGQASTSTSSSANKSASNGNPIADSVNGATKDEAAMKKALEEEEHMLNKLKEKHIQEKSKKTSNNPFLASPTETKTEVPPTGTGIGTQPIVDLFSNSLTNEIQSSKLQTTQSQDTSKGLDDLLNLSSNVNPFAGILNAAANQNLAGQAQLGQPILGAGVPFFAGMPQQPFGMPMGMPFNNGNVIPNVLTQPTQPFGQPDTGFAAFSSEPSATSGIPEGNDMEGKDESNTEGDERNEAIQSQVEQPTVTLDVPEDGSSPNRSTSPSPTHEIHMKGAGTTPILQNPEVGFPDSELSGDEHNISPGNTPSSAKNSPAKIRAPPPSGESSPFSTSFEPTFADFNAAIVSEQAKSASSPTRPPPPDKSPTKERPPARPPPARPAPPSISPDKEGEEGGAPTRPPLPNVSANALPTAQQQLLIQQYLVYQQMQAAQMAQFQQLLEQQQRKPASAFEDLDLSMRQTMAKPEKPVATQEQQQLQQMQQQLLIQQQFLQRQALLLQQQGLVIPGLTMMPGVTSGLDAFGDVLQPQLINSNQSATNSITNNNNTTAQPQGSLIKGDLDSSLASLAQNLDISGPKGSFKKPGQQQFASPKNTVKTGAPVQPSGQQGWFAGQPNAGSGVAWNANANLTGVQPISQTGIPGVQPAGGWTQPAGGQINRKM